MTPLSLVPLSWKIGAALALVGALATAHTWRVHQADRDGFDRAVSERGARDAVAVVARVQDNAALSIKQDSINAVLTKVKNEELTPVRSRIAAAPSVRVGTAICGPAPAAQAQDAGSGDGANPSGRLVRPDVDRDIRALKLAVEEDLATGRACQAWGKKNGFVP
jgi:prophage endopeptidase